MNLRDFNDALGVRMLPVLNDSGEAIPPLAAMRISGLNTTYGVYTVGKPDAASQTQGIVFNGPTEIGTGLRGAAFMNPPVMALGHPDDDAPVAGDDWGTEADEWKLRKDNTGFKAIGNILTNDLGHFMQVDRAASSGSGGALELVDTFSGTLSYASDPLELFDTGAVAAGEYLVFGNVIVDHDLDVSSAPANGVYFVSGLDVLQFAGTGIHADSLPTFYEQSYLSLLAAGTAAASGDTGERPANGHFTLASYIKMSDGNGFKLNYYTSADSPVLHTTTPGASIGDLPGVIFRASLWRVN